MDICDRANSEIEIGRLNNLYQAKTKAASQPHVDVVSKTRYCIDCGEEIPAERLKAVPGTVRCLHCQNEYERRTRY